MTLSFLSDSATQFLTKSIEEEARENGLNLNIWEAPIDQIDSQILNPKSEFNSKKYDTTIIFESTHSLLEKFNNSKNKIQFANQQFIRLCQLFETVLSSSSTKIIVFNFYEINDYSFGNQSTKTPNAFIHQLRLLNVKLNEYCFQKQRLTIFDISSIQNKIGSDNFFHPALYVNYGMLINYEYSPMIARHLVTIFLVNNAQFKKCLILDLDNTLWGGIIGDDGIENIQLGNLGIGKSFLAFQQWVKQLKERGIIICICSKNSENTAKNVFLNHPDMILKLEDISVFIANWKSKVDNIKKIKEVLNIGYDAIVFVDDNPYERDAVRENLPRVTVPQLPNDPSNYLDYLYAQNYFEINTASKLDKNRTLMYQEEYDRVKTKINFTDLSAYMASLKMKSNLDDLTKFNIPRVSQLSFRSNQFNLTTTRYSEGDLKKIKKSKEKEGLIFDLEDRYGSYGIICYLILVKESSKVLVIENWAMSCRVLERGMEQFVLNQLVDYSHKKGYTTLVGIFSPSKKNGIVEKLYEKLGFNQTNDRYELVINKHKRLNTKIQLGNGEN